jgi:hypothetical protein
MVKTIIKKLYFKVSKWNNKNELAGLHMGRGGSQACGPELACRGPNDRVIGVTYVARTTTRSPLSP